MRRILRHTFVEKALKTSVFAVFFFLLFLVGCNRINTDWHSYEKRKLEMAGPDSHQLEVLSDRWKISKKSEGKREEEGYEWMWEMKIRSEGSEALRLRKLGAEDTLGFVGEICYLKEIKYTLYDKQGLELISDTLENQYIEYGTIKLFSHTSKISMDKAEQASQSSFKIFTTQL